MKRFAPLLVSALLLIGCFGQPGSRAEDELGDVDHEPTGEFHRPGQPCLVCHGPDYTPGDDVFSIAGTVYEFADSEAGLEGVDVVVIDSRGRELRMRSNRVGNFYAEEEDATVEFPVTVSLERDGERRRMRSPIFREGSCAHCHTKDGPHASSVGRVFLRDSL